MNLTYLFRGSIMNKRIAYKISQRDTNNYKDLYTQQQINKANNIIARILSRNFSKIKWGAFYKPAGTWKTPEQWNNRQTGLPSPANI